MQILGIDIGGTKCAVSRLQSDGKVVETARFATMNPRDTCSRLIEEVGRLDPGPDPFFGISCGGPLDSVRGIILSPPNLPAWDRIAICDELTRRFGGRAFLMNDANACALAEWQFGAGRGSKSMIFLTAGTGMGAGLIVNERLCEGATGDAGEVGHIRLSNEGPVGFGKAGSFEGFCSGGGIARLARMRLDGYAGKPPEWAWPGEEISTQKIAEAAGRKEPFALSILREAGERFGQALAILIDILNPERIVIGGIFPPCGPLLISSMEEALRRDALPSLLAACAIVPAELGESIGSHGAIAAALYGAGIKTAVICTSK
jgi:glucokinase